jgi:hypothetical protein
LAAGTLNQPITFDFVGQALTAGTTYFIVAEKMSGDGAVNWRPPATTAGNPATAQNGSGWTNLGTNTATNSTDNGATWTSSGFGNAAAISLVAVPEPSTWALAGMGLLAAGFARRVRAIFGR